MPSDEYMKVVEENYIQFLVDWVDGLGLLEEHCFTFPDGMTWWATGR